MPLKKRDFLDFLSFLARVFQKTYAKNDQNSKKKNTFFQREDSLGTRLPCILRVWRDMAFSFGVEVAAAGVHWGPSGLDLVAVTSSAIARGHRPPPIGCLYSSVCWDPRFEMREGFQHSR